MAKELYIYSSLYDFTAETVVNQLNNISDNEELTVRMNTPGGNVTAGWAIISKLSERNSITNAIIDGDAASMGALMLLFFDNVIANDTSSIMFHKAAYPSYYEPSEAEQNKLKTINAQFQEKLTAKVEGNPGAKEFLDKVFESDVRNDVELTPAEAKKLGIVNEIRTLTPKAEYIGTQIVALIESKSPSKEDNININTKSMDLAKLKAEHPAIYQAAFAEGESKGQKTERERVEAWTVYNEVNPEKVKAGIESGEPLSGKAMAEMNLEIAKSSKVEAMKKDNPKTPETPAEAKTEEELKAEAQKTEMDKLFGEDK